MGYTIAEKSKSIIWVQITVAVVSTYLTQLFKVEVFRCTYTYLSYSTYYVVKDEWPYIVSKSPNSLLDDRVSKADHQLRPPWFSKSRLWTREEICYTPCNCILLKHIFEIGSEWAVKNHSFTALHSGQLWFKKRHSSYLPIWFINEMKWKLYIPN